MSSLFWRTFIAPQLRHPGLLVTGILGVAFCVSLFFSMGIASEKALKTIAEDDGQLIPYPQHATLSTLTLRKGQGRLDRSDVLACVQRSHLGFVCRASVRLKLGEEGTKNNISVTGVWGSTPSTLLPIFSTDLARNIRLKGKTIAATSASSRLQKAVILDYRDLVEILGTEIGFDELQIAPATFLTLPANQWRTQVDRFVAGIAADSEWILQAGEDEVQEKLSLTSSYRLNLLILTATSILVAGLFLWNIAALQIQNRKRSLAILRQVGIQRRQGLHLLLAEQVCVALAGSCLGILIGGYLERIVSSLTLQTLSDLYIESSIVPEVPVIDNAVLAAIFGVTFYLLACSQLTWSLLQVTPRELRVTIKKSASYVRLRTVVAILALLSLPSAYFAPNFVIGLVSERPQPYLAYISAFGIFVITFASSPLANRATQQIVKTLASTKILGRAPTLKIATTRYLRASLGGGTSIATVASALTLSLGIAIMVSSFRTSVTEWFDRVFLAEVVVNGKQMTTDSRYELVPSAQVSAIAALPNTTAMDCLVRAEGEFQGLPIKIYGMAYTGADSSQTPLVFRSSTKELRTLLQFRSNFSPGDVVINEPLANRYQIRLDQSITLRLAGWPPETYRVIGIVQDYGSEGGYALLPTVHAPQLASIPGCHSLRVYGAQVSASYLTAAIQALDRDQLAMEAMTTAQLRSLVIDTFDQTFAITDVMTLLAVILGGLALLVHVAQSTYDGKDEWLALRRIGVSWQCLWRIALWDNVFVLVCGSMLGVAGGLGLAWVLVFLINVKSFGWSFQMDLATVLTDGGRIVATFVALLLLLSAVLTLRLIRPGERWQRWRE